MRKKAQNLRVPLKIFCWDIVNQVKEQKTEVRPRSQESRPRSASRTKAKSPLSPEDRLIPPSQRRKRKSNQDEGEAEESEKENEDSPAQKKQKVRTKIVTNPYDLLT